MSKGINKVIPEIFYWMIYYIQQILLRHYVVKKLITFYGNI